PGRAGPAAAGESAAGAVHRPGRADPGGPDRRPPERCGGRLADQQRLCVARPFRSRDPSPAAARLRAVSGQAGRMIRTRYMDEWVGLLVLVSVAVFFGVALQAGVLRDWFKPVSTLRILLPEAGVAGLSVGADVEVLGTKAGTITRVVIDPSQQMYA